MMLRAVQSIEGEGAGPGEAQGFKTLTFWTAGASQGGALLKGSGGDFLGKISSNCSNNDVIYDASDGLGGNDSCFVMACHCYLL